MAYRTAQLADFDTYLESEYPDASGGAADARAAEGRERQIRLVDFPFDVVLAVAYAELDCADRWCWQQFGPADGECRQSSSEYSECGLQDPHSHPGRWRTH